MNKTFKVVQKTEYYITNSNINNVKVDNGAVNWLYDKLTNYFDSPMNYYLKEYKYVSSKLIKQLQNMDDVYSKGNFMYMSYNYSNEEVDRSWSSRIPVIQLSIYNGKIGYGIPSILIHYKINGTIKFEIDYGSNIPNEDYIINEFIPNNKYFIKYMLEIFKRISI